MASTDVDYVPMRFVPPSYAIATRCPGLKQAGALPGGRENGPSFATDGHSRQQRGQLAHDGDDADDDDDAGDADDDDDSFDGDCDDDHVVSP
eukprot:2882078-Rhodomonas_salina.2